MDRNLRPPEIVDRVEAFRHLTGASMDLLSKYHIGKYDIDIDYGGACEVTLSMPCAGFAALASDLQSVHNPDPTIIQQELQESDDIWVIRFPASRFLDEIARQAQTLCEQYPNQKMVWLPSDENISQMGPEELKQVYEYLGKVLDNFSFDKIMDF